MISGTALAIAANAHWIALAVIVLIWLKYG